MYMRLAEHLPKFLLRHRAIEFLCKLGLQQRLCRIDFNGNATSYIDLMDPEPRNTFIKNSFEPDFFELAKCFLTDDGGTFFDLGANMGFCSFGLLPIKPMCNYHLFEANPKIIELLGHSIEYHSNTSIKLTHACVTSEEGTCKFCLSTEQSGQSHVATVDESGISIPSITLDGYCLANNISKIDFAKIDLEGHELSALKGWKTCLRDQTVKAIYIEIMEENQKRYGLKTNEPLLFLESLGYELFLCKEDDFTDFGEPPKKYEFESNNLILSKFQARNLPRNFATDVLALTRDKLID
jgi:FkbM family methyltransferase